MFIMLKHNTDFLFLWKNLIKIKYVFNSFVFILKCNTSNLLVPKT